MILYEMRQDRRLGMTETPSRVYAWL
jgi:hypothetical protein